MINKSYKLTYLILALTAPNLSANPLKFAAELYRISKIGDTKTSSISNTALVGEISNVLTALWLPTKGIKQLLAVLADTIKNEAKITAAAVDLLPSFTAPYFYLLDQELGKNAKEIAKYNKLTNRNVSYEKNQQRLWLIANYFLPMISEKFFASKAAKYFPYANQVDHLNTTVDIIFALSNISEIIRQHYKYKADFGNYKNFSNYNSYDAKELKNFN